MKLNLVIDASGIFYRSLFTIGTFGVNKGEKLLDSKKSQGIFMRKLATDFSTLVRIVDTPSKIIICMDSQSWRKSIIIDDGGYKADRKKDESTINWQAFFELTDKFCELLSQKGYIVSRIPGAEADDLLFFWSNKLNSAGENVMMITGDRDLLQVVKNNENGTWTIALDPVSSRKKISLTQETFESSTTPKESVTDIFNTSSWTTSEDMLSMLLSTHELNIVDTKKLSSIKVLLGDSGDSVPSVITWKDKKEPTKMRSMTENNYSKIIASHPELEHVTWKELRDGKFLEEIATTMESIKKIEVDRELLLVNIERNCKLVILSDETIPHQIRDSFDRAHTDISDSAAITGKDGILNGTEWWSNDKTVYVPKSYDLFE